jgi:DNA segregation ATPase FtsK/SpoIIIE-like protein
MVRTTGRLPNVASDTPALEEINLPEMVKLADIAPSPTLKNLTLGVSQNGVITASLYDLMHVLAVGASGFGKSAFLRALVWQIAQVPENVGVVAIDINGSEFNIIRNWARLLYPVARTTQEAIATLQAVGGEIERRKGLYEQHPSAYDLPSYNTQAQEALLSPIVVLADEATNLLNQDGIGDPLREVTQTARQYGIYLLLAGQSAKHSVIDTQTRDNFSSRLCFHTSPASYRTVLGQSVDDVTTRGRAWAQLTGATLQQVQCPYVTRQEVQQVLGVGTPQNALDLESVRPQPNDMVQRIRELRDHGKSMNAIQQELFGYTGGNAYNTVKLALG